MSETPVPDDLPDEDPYADRYDGGRTPPQDTAAEQAILGAMMLVRPEDLTEVLSSLTGPDFYRPAHEAIYEAITDLYAAGEPIDAITVAHALTRAGKIRQIGGAPYLHTLVANAPVVASLDHYADMVREKALLRRVAEAGSRIQHWAYADDAEADAVMDRAQAEVMDAVPRRTAQDYRVVADVLGETLDAVDAAADPDQNVGVPTGFYDLDDLTGGFKAGQMITVAGRPGLGKSTLAIDFARAASIRNNLASCVFSLEMTRIEITTRLLSAEAKVPLANLRSGQLSESEWAKIALASGPVTAAPLFIDDSPNLTMTEIRAKARRLRQSHDLRLVVIDYLQLMSSGKKVESRQTEVSEFSRQIKLLAKELEVPIVALSQLNRGPEQRTSKRPLMSDLRESGSIEQDSDIVILLHREDAYEQESSRPGEADLIVAKHRNGPTRDIAVAAQLHYSRFSDLANERPVR